MITGLLLRSTDNQILKRLPISDYSKIQHYLESVKLKQGETIQRFGEPVKYIYFPQTCIIAVLTVFRSGTSIESGIVGAEGVIGTTGATLPLDAHREAQALVSGQCLRIKAEAFRLLVAQYDSLQSAIQKYLCVFNEQVAQLGACNSCHSLKERLARLLLLCSLDNKVPVTQETVSLMLGVHRPSISKIALMFKKNNLITYLRGSLVITDKQGLEAEACECYQLIRDNFSVYYAGLREAQVKLPVTPVPRLPERRSPTRQKPILIA